MGVRGDEQLRLGNHSNSCSNPFWFIHSGSPILVQTSNLLATDCVNDFAQPALP